MFDVMKFASLVHKEVMGNPPILPPGEIFEMATQRGAAALGLPVGVVLAWFQGRFSYWCGWMVSTSSRVRPKPLSQIWFTQRVGPMPPWS